MKACLVPFVEIDGLFFEDNPAIYKRSQLISSTGLTRCVDNLPHNKKWTMKSSSTGQEIDLTDNPTSDKNELVIQPNTLPYGLYMITYGIYSKGDNSLLSQQSTFVKVIETGIAVYGLEYGTSNLKLGYAQIIVFEPNKFTFDFDYIADVSSLDYKYFCAKLEQNDNSSTSSINFGSELKEAKSNNVPLSSTCFDSTGNFFYYL